MVMLGGKKFNDTITYERSKTQMRGQQNMFNLSVIVCVHPLVSVLFFV